MIAPSGAIGGREDRKGVGEAILLFLTMLTVYLPSLAIILFAAYSIHVYIYKHLSMYVR